MHFPGKEIPRNVDISDGEASHVSLGRKSTGCIKKVEERARPRADSVCPEAVDSFDPRCVVTSLHRPSLNFQMTRPRRKRILSLSLSCLSWYSYFSKASRYRTWIGNGMGIRARLEKPHLQLTVTIRSSWDILKSYYITRWDCSDNKEFLTSHIVSEGIYQALDSLAG